MNNASEQFRARAGIKGDPSPELGLENAAGKKGGKPINLAEGDATHPAEPVDTKVASTETGERVAEKKAARGQQAAAKKTAAKKTAAKRSTAKKGAAKKTAAKKTAKK